MSDIDEADYDNGGPREQKPSKQTSGESAHRNRRGRGKRDIGDKPLVTVRWDEPVTQDLWKLIKSHMDLKPVLMADPPRVIGPGPNGGSNSPFSKKDAHKRIATILFGTKYDLKDEKVMELLTRAVKNKIHKTQLLYDSFLRRLGENFCQYKTEAQIPTESLDAWNQLRDRFPTFFQYQDLIQDIPKLGPASTDIPSDWRDIYDAFNDQRYRSQFLNHIKLLGRQQSSGFGLPDGVGVGFTNFEVVPPNPNDVASDLSDMESASYCAPPGPSRSPSRSPVPYLSASRQSTGGMGMLDASYVSPYSNSEYSGSSISQFSDNITNNPSLSPTQSIAPESYGPLSQGGQSANGRGTMSTMAQLGVASNPGSFVAGRSPNLASDSPLEPGSISHSPNSLALATNLRNLNNSPTLVASPQTFEKPTDIQPGRGRQTRIQSADTAHSQAFSSQWPMSKSSPFSGNASLSRNAPAARSSGEKAIPTLSAQSGPSSNPQNRVILNARSPRLRMGGPLPANPAPRQPNAHQRSHSTSSLGTNFTVDTTTDKAASVGDPRSPGDLSSPPSPDSGEDPVLNDALVTVINMLQAKNERKRQRQEAWVEHKRKKFEEKQRQREENERRRQEAERQREENERQRQHTELMMRLQLDLARIEASKKSGQAQDQGLGSSAIQSGMQPQSSIQVGNLGSALQSSHALPTSASAQTSPMQLQPPLQNLQSPVVYTTPPSILTSPPTTHPNISGNINNQYGDMSGMQADQALGLNFLSSPASRSDYQLHRSTVVSPQGQAQQLLQFQHSPGHMDHQTPNIHQMPQELHPTPHSFQQHLHHTPLHPQAQLQQSAVQHPQQLPATGLDLMLMVSPHEQFANLNPWYPQYGNQNSIVQASQNSPLGHMIPQPQATGRTDQWMEGITSLDPGFMIDPNQIDDQELLRFIQSADPNSQDNNGFIQQSQNSNMGQGGNSQQFGYHPQR